MFTNSLAVVVPIRNLQGNDQECGAAVWQQASRLLLTQLGSRYSRFQPAERAWEQSVGRPFGVVLGRSDPALFLYFYAAAKAAQEAAIHHHMEQFMDGVEIAAKSEQPGFSMYAVEIKGDGSNLAPHMEWHMAMLCGELLPDCGIYHLAEKLAFADEALDKKVLSDLGGYALCVVKLMLEARA